MLAPVLPIALHQREVALVELAEPNLLMQRSECAALLGQHQDAGSLTVETMHQLQKAQRRPSRTQLLDHAVAHPRATVNRDAGRFVDNQQRLIFKQDRKLGGRRLVLRRLG